MICYQCSIDKNGVSSTENKLFTVEKRDFHKLLDMMSQTSKNTDAMKFTCFQSLFRLGFPPGMAGREISREIRGFGISRFPGNLCRDPGKFSYAVPD